MDTHDPSLTLATTLVRVLGISLLSAALIPAALHIYRDYRAYIDLGPGGTPSTFAGYLRVTALGFFALKNPYQPTTSLRALLLPPHGFFAAAALPRRAGPRPRTRGIAPHRQIDGKGGQRMFERLAQEIACLADADEQLVLGTSCFEKHGTGLFSTAPRQRTCSGEICHAHPSDGSLHLTLHPADAAVVLNGGWGERHPLSRGGWFERFVPEGFLMVYAPREEEELAVVLLIVRAAAWFVGGGGGGAAGVVKGGVGVGAGVLAKSGSLKERFGENVERVKCVAEGRAWL